MNQLPKKGLFVGKSHAKGGIPSKIAETGQLLEIEGDEYYICKQAYQSQKHYKFENKTNKQILDKIYTDFSCKLKQSEMHANDFIVCKVVVKDPTPKSRSGTVAEILNQMQAEKSCKVESQHFLLRKGGFICPQGTEIQSLIFEKSKFNNGTKAKNWAKQHGFKATKLDEKDNTYRIRQQTPKSFKENTFRTINIDGGIKAVIGCPIKMEDGGKIEDKIKTGLLTLEKYANPSLKKIINKQLVKIEHPNLYEEGGEIEILDFSEIDGSGNKIATFSSIAKYIAKKLNTGIELYHKSSSSGSEYYKLTDIYKKSGGFLHLRISDHEIISRGNVASLGGADEEYYKSVKENDVYDLEELNEFIEYLSSEIDTENSLYTRKRNLETGGKLTLSEGDNTNLGVIQEVYNDQYKIKGNWYHNSLVKPSSEPAKPEKIKNRGVIVPKHIISAFANPIDQQKVEDYKTQFEHLGLSHNFPPIKGYPDVITEEDFGDYFINGIEITENDLGTYVWKVTDGHHRSYAALEANLPYIHTELDTTALADDTLYLEEGGQLTVDNAKYGFPPILTPLT